MVDVQQKHVCFVQLAGRYQISADRWLIKRLSTCCLSASVITVHTKQINVFCLKKNLYASRSSEHPIQGGGKSPPRELVATLLLLIAHIYNSILLTGVLAIVVRLVCCLFTYYL